MADHLYSRIHAANDDEEIVITGMAGRFPNSNHVAEFRDNLYNKVMKAPRVKFRSFKFHSKFIKVRSPKLI